MFTSPKSYKPQKRALCDLKGQPSPFVRMIEWEENRSPYTIELISNLTNLMTESLPKSSYFGGIFAVGRTSYDSYLAVQVPEDSTQNRNIKVDSDIELSRLHWKMSRNQNSSGDVNEIFYFKEFVEKQLANAEKLSRLEHKTLIQLLAYLDHLPVPSLNYLNSSNTLTNVISSLISMLTDSKKDPVSLPACIACLAHVIEGHLAFESVLTGKVEYI